MKKKVEFYDCLKKFKFINNDKLRSIRSINRKRNETKIIKVFINWNNKWYIKLDKLNRNLHIETEDNSEIKIFTDY